MTIYSIVPILVFLYLYIPILITRWYIYLRHDGIFTIHFLLSIICLIIFYFNYNVDLEFTRKGAILMLISPFIFLVLFKLLDLGAIKIYKRHLIVTNEKIMTARDKKKKKNYDMFSSILLSIIPFSIPMALRELEIL